MKREGACSCGAVRFVVDGPVRDVLICHCAACCEAAGGPWAASAAHRPDLTIAGTGDLLWKDAADSEAGASRGSCRLCGTALFWDAPGRETVSFAVTSLAGAPELEVAAHIWVAPGDDFGDCPTYGGGLPASVSVPWHG